MEIITAATAARILGINKRTLYRWEDEGRIRAKREGVLNVRVYTKSYIEMVKQIIDLNTEEKEHLKMLPEVRDRVKKHLFAQDVSAVRAGETIKLMDIEKATEAFDMEEAWVKKHNEILRKLFSYPRDIIKEVLQIK